VKRHGSIVAIAAASFASAVFWFAVATRPYNMQLERERPPDVYDFFSYYRPNAEWAFARMRSGDIPLWNPNQGLGGPFLATLQTGVLYPPNALHAVLPTQTAYVWLAIAHLALAGLLAGALAGKLGARPVGAVAAGLLYAGSFQLWSSVFTPPTLYTAAWAPGVILAAVRAVTRPGVGAAALLAGAVALQMLVGWPFAVSMTALAAAIVVGAELVRETLRRRRLPLAATATLLVGVAAGILVAAPQLLPSYELMRLSTRAVGTLDDTTAGLLGPMHDPAVFAGELIHRGVNGGVPGIASPVLALAAVILAGRGRARAAVLLGVALLALATSFSTHTPLYGIVRRLPLLGDFRFPFRYRLLSTLALAVCAGIGVTRIEERAGRSAIWIALLCAAIAVGWQAAAMTRSGVRPFPRSQPRPTGGLLADIARTNEFERQLAEVRRPENAGFRSYWDSFGVDKLGEREGLATLQDLEPLSLGTTSRVMTFLATGDAGVDPASHTRVRPALPAPFSGTAPLLGDESRAALLDLMSVRSIVTPAPPTWLDTRYRRVDAVRDPPFVYENPHTFPRAWRAARAEEQPGDPQVALERLVDPTFDVRRTVLLDPLPLEVSAWSVDTDDGAATHFEIDEPERLRIRTQGAHPAVLVVNDAWYPGWTASVDGVAVPLLRANTAFRAVVVPAGEHRVDMIYAPPAFRLGVLLAAVSAAGLAVALGIGAALRARRRADRREHRG